MNNLHLYQSLVFRWSTWGRLAQGKIKGTSCQLLLLTIFLLGASGCQTTQSVAGTNYKPLPKRSSTFLLKRLVKQRIQYQWWGCRAKLKLDSPQEKAIFFAKIRMQKDSLIWLSLRKMSVEGARVRISPTQIEILDRQNGQYLKRPFRYLAERYGLSLSFQDLQDLIAGNPVLYHDQPLLSSIAGKRYRLATPSKQAEVLRIFLDGTNYRLSELNGSQANNVVEITYDQYEAFDQQNIPLKRHLFVETADDEQGTLDMTYSNLVLDKVQKVGFSIPDSYEVL